MKPDPVTEMRTFWDEKARENATYYISSYRPYDDQDVVEFWRWGETLTARLLDESEIAFSGHERVLEIGCGIGRLTSPLAARFREVVGLDVAPEMVRRAREALRDRTNVTIELGNGADFSGFGDGSFDLVFSYLVLQHLPESTLVAGYLREIGRVLRPGGWCHVQVNGETAPPEAERPGWAQRMRASASGAIRRLFGRGGPRGLESPAWRGCRVPLAAAREMVSAAGLELVRWRGEDTQYLWLTVRKPQNA